MRLGPFIVTTFHRRKSKLFKKKLSIEQDFGDSLQICFVITAPVSFIHSAET
jgi:hypothetical protein